MTATLLALVASTTQAADYKVSQTLQVDAKITDVWHKIGDFCDIDDWHPDITTCALKVVDGRLHRVVSMQDGSKISEQRIAAEQGLSYTYKINASPLPLDSYTATLAVEPLNGTQITWSARFSSDDASMEAMVQNLIATGLASIENKLAAH